MPCTRSGSKAKVRSIADGAGQVLAGRLVLAVSYVLELPVRRLPRVTGDGATLVLDDTHIDDAGGPDRLDDGPVDGPRVHLDDVGVPAVAGGEDRELDRSRPRSR